MLKGYYNGRLSDIISRATQVLETDINLIGFTGLMNLRKTVGQLLLLNHETFKYSATVFLLAVFLEVLWRGSVAKHIKFELFLLVIVILGTLNIFFKEG